MTQDAGRSRDENLRLVGGILFIAAMGILLVALVLAYTDLQVWALIAVGCAVNCISQVLIWAAHRQKAGREAVRDSQSTSWTGG